jgi:hypothetical protein
MELSFQAILFIIGGVVFGLVVGWFITMIKSKFIINGHKKELQEYKEHLNRQMKITNEGSKNLEEDLIKLKKENENLRISVQTLGQKPGRAEIRLLNIYDAALRKMQMKAPGFSSAWEAALQEAEAEYEANEKGFKSIIKKVFGPSLTHQSESLKEIGDLPKGFESK